MAEKVIATLQRARETVDGLVGPSESVEYSEGVFDAVCVLDELINQWESDPESCAAELGLDD